jgi:hypothetical protein
MFSYVFVVAERVYFNPRRSGWSPDRKRLLGAVLSGARNPTRWPDAVGQNGRRWG